MQYRQRKLQRSVTEMRRYSMLRPKRSRSVTLTYAATPLARRGVDPLARSVDVVLPLPDRHALLDLLDHVAGASNAGAAMRVRDGDRDAGLSEREHPDSMLDDERRDAKAVRCLGDDLLPARASAMEVYAE